jgi:hypothetical protein
MEVINGQNYDVTAVLWQYFDQGDQVGLIFAYWAIAYCPKAVFL